MFESLITRYNKPKYELCGMTCKIPVAAGHATDQAIT
jgi:hypothetical protein